MNTFKQKGDDPLDSSIEREIEKCPDGARAPDIARATGRDVSTIRWRLMTLELMGRVERVRQRGVVSYFLQNEG